MRLINLAYFTSLGEALGDIEGFGIVTSPTEGQWIGKTAACAQLLQALLTEGTVPLSIPASAPEIRSLINALNQFGAASEDERQGLAIGVWTQATKVKTLLNGELAIQSAYYVWPKRAYDTKRLVDFGVQIFAPEVQQWFTLREVYDINQAGKCIAFEVPTAAGFHLIRAAESVIRRYYQLVVGTLPKPKMRSWGVYVRNLRECGAEPKVVSVIEQVKEFHRNPVMHPEEELSMEEALSLLGISESLVSAIYRDMAARTASGEPMMALLGSPELAQQPAKVVRAKMAKKPI
jgi:hypothetical protein